MKTYLALLVMAVNATVGITESFAQNQVAAWGDYSSGQLLLPNGLHNVKQIAAGNSHSLALRSDGTVIGWGDDSYKAATVPTGLSNVLAIAAGGRHSLALRVDGTVVAWGSNANGQTNVPMALSNVIQISAGATHSLALKGDGKVVAWGGGINGEGNVPPDLSNVKSIVAGVGISLALKRDGTVIAWGSTNNGSVPSGLLNVIAMASGAHQNLALKSDGTVVAWGAGYAGQTNPPPGLSNVVAVSVGTDQSLALKANGIVVAWGSGLYGLTNVPSGLSNVTAIAAGGSYNLAIVPDGPPEIIAEPAAIGVPYQSNLVLTVTARGLEPMNYRWTLNGFSIANTTRISGSQNASLIISNAQFTDAGIYRVMVTNAFGSVQSTGAMVTVVSPPIFTQQPASRTIIAGTNTTLSVAAMGTPVVRYQWMFNGEPLPGQTKTLLNLTNVQHVNAGNYSVLASNAYGATPSSNAVVSVTEVAPYILTQPTNRSVFVGGSAKFSVNAHGTEPLSYQWLRGGKNISGATNSTLSLMGLQFDDEGFYAVAVSNSVGVTISAKAFLAVSTVTIWGTQVPSALTSFPPGLSNVVAISAGQSHIVALKADGTVRAWGSKVVSVASGGWTNSFIETNSPATNVPPNLNDVVAISAGDFHNLALKADGTVVAWGDNTSGQTNVPLGLSNVIAIAAGGDNSLALRADDVIIAWGGAGFPPRILSTTLTNVPPGLSNLMAVAAGEAHGMALKNDGRVALWGASSNSPPGLSNVIAIAFGKGSSGILYPGLTPYKVGSSDDYLALRSDGTVVSWSDRYVTLPNGFAPVSGLSNMVAISGGSSSIMALRSDGSVYVSQATSQAPQSLTNVIAIAAGGKLPNFFPYTVPVSATGFFVAAVGNGSPTFTLQPASQRAIRGGQIQLHARAVGVQPLPFQWQLNGTNIFGATNGTLTISNFQPENIGAYRAIVSNAFGVATSKVASVSLPVPSLPVAVNASVLPWMTRGSTSDGNWFSQVIETHDGDASAQSGAISHDQFSELQTTVTGPGNIRFWWKVSSEQGYDFLQFFVGETNVPLAVLSGETGWQQQIFSVPAGSQTLKWIYSKDESVSAGADAGWLDEVLFTPAAIPADLQFFAPQILDDGSLLLPVSRADGRAVSLDDLEGVELQASSNLVDWLALTNGGFTVTLSNGLFLIQDASKTNWPTRFYRVIHR